jgi:hypothetical protein
MSDQLTRRISSVSDGLTAASIITYIARSVVNINAAGRWKLSEESNDVADQFRARSRCGHPATPSLELPSTSQLKGEVDPRFQTPVFMSAKPRVM